MVQNMSKVDQKRSKGNMTLDQNMSNVGQKCPDCTKNSPCSIPYFGYPLTVPITGKGGRGEGIASYNS